MKINNNDENHNSSYGDLFSQNSEDSNSFDFNTLEDSLNEVLNENTKSENDISWTSDQSSEKTNSSHISQLKNNENILRTGGFDIATGSDLNFIFDSFAKEHSLSIYSSDTGRLHGSWESCIVTYYILIIICPETN